MTTKRRSAHVSSPDPKGLSAPVDGATCEPTVQVWLSTSTDLPSSLTQRSEQEHPTRRCALLTCNAANWWRSGVAR